MPYNTSKPISKTDESSKELIMEALDGNFTYGFDIDSIYYFENTDKWVVIEFLKCEHETASPSDSHPSRYWKRNWRKFASIWKLSQRLSASLYLVNYEDLQHAQLQGRTEREFHVIQVTDMQPTENGGITGEYGFTMTFRVFQSWFRRLNTGRINHDIAIGRDGYSI